MSRLYKGIRYNRNKSFYEHRLIAEKMLGRKLRKGECVHHIDENKRNNVPSNLMIFVSVAAHTMFHMGGELIPTNEKNVYDCKSNSIYTCEICGKILKDYRATKCLSCSRITRRKAKRPDPDTLVQEIKNSSYLAVGKKYGVSDSAVKKWLRSYGIDPKTIRTIKDNHFVNLKIKGKVAE